MLHVQLPLQSCNAYVSLFHIYPPKMGCHICWYLKFCTSLQAGNRWCAIFRVVNYGEWLCLWNANSSPQIFWQLFQAKAEICQYKNWINMEPLEREFTEVSEEKGLPRRTSAATSPVKVQLYSTWNKMQNIRKEVDRPGKAEAKQCHNPKKIKNLIPKCYTAPIAYLTVVM